jgi:RNA polymerase sigma-70 factor (ECF subfamily)
VTGDRGFEALVERHSAEIYAYLWRMLRDPEAASDCLQETYLRAWRAFPRLRHREHLRAWLYTIATRRARSALRDTARRARRQQTLCEDLADPGASVGRTIVGRESLRRLLQAVERLPAKQKEALILRRYQGLSYAEIASASGGTEAAARMNVHLAVEKLRAVLADEGAGNDGGASRGRLMNG